MLGIALGMTDAAIAAPNDQVRSKRQQAEAARGQIEALGMRLESAVERYNSAQAQLGDVRTAIADNEHSIRVTRASVRSAKTALADRLVLEYRSGDPDALAALLGARSLSEMLAQVSVMRRASQQTARIIGDLLSAQRELTRREKQLAADRRRAATLVAQRSAAKQELERGIAAQHDLVRGLEGEIAQLQREERARQRRIAEEAQQRLAAARTAERAAAANDPGLGGSGNASTGSVGGSSGSGDNVGSGSGGASSGSAGGGSAPIPPPASGSLGGRAVAAAMRWLGTPYSWGGGNARGPSRGIAQGAGTVGFDCSGLTLYAYAQVGISLGHFTGTQWQSGQRIGRMSDLAVGDLVFFGSDLGHMGMYIGGGQMINAPQTGDVVKISDISSGYYASRFRGGVRPY